MPVVSAASETMEMRGFPFTAPLFGRKWVQWFPVRQAFGIDLEPDLKPRFPRLILVC